MGHHFFIALSEASFYFIILLLVGILDCPTLFRFEAQLGGRGGVVGATNSWKMFTFNLEEDSGGEHSPHLAPHHQSENLVVQSLSPLCYYSEATVPGSGGDGVRAEKIFDKEHIHQRLRGPAHYTSGATCSVKRKVLCPSGRKEGEKNSRKGKALVMLMLSGNFDEFEETTEWTNIEYFLRMAYIKSGVETELFDEVDFVIYQIGGEREQEADHSSGSSDSVKEVTLFAEAAGNVKFLIVPPGPCDLCAHGRVLEYLGFRGLKDPREEKILVRQGTSRNDASSRGEDGRSRSSEASSPSSTSTSVPWPYKSVVMLNSGVRGPFIHTSSSSSSWIDVVSMAGESTRPLFMDDDISLGFSTVGGTRIERQVILGAMTMPLHLQSYFLVVPISVLSYYYNSFLNDGCLKEIKEPLRSRVLREAATGHPVSIWPLKGVKGACILNCEIRTADGFLLGWKWPQANFTRKNLSRQLEETQEVSGGLGGGERGVEQQSQNQGISQSSSEYGDIVYFPRIFSFAYGLFTHEFNVSSTERAQQHFDETQQLNAKFTSQKKGTDGTMMNFPGWTPNYVDPCAAIFVKFGGEVFEVMGSAFQASVSALTRRVLFTTNRDIPQEIVAGLIRMGRRSGE